MDESNFQPQTGSSGLKTAVLAGAIIALLAANVFLYLQLGRLRTDMTKLKESKIGRAHV